MKALTTPTSLDSSEICEKSPCFQEERNRTKHNNKLGEQPVRSATYACPKSNDGFSIVMYPSTSPGGAKYRALLEGQDSRVSQMKLKGKKLKIEQSENCVQEVFLSTRHYISGDVRSQSPQISKTLSTTSQRKVNDESPTILAAPADWSQKHPRCGSFGNSSPRAIPPRTEVPHRTVQTNAIQPTTPCAINS